MSKEEKFKRSIFMATCVNGIKGTFNVKDGGGAGLVLIFPTFRDEC